MHVRTSYNYSGGFSPGPAPAVAARLAAQQLVTLGLNRLWARACSGSSRWWCRGGPVWTAAAAGALVSQATETVRWVQGSTTTESYAQRSKERAVQTLGVASGAWLGAVVGSAILPGPGTMLVSSVGSLLGNHLAEASLRAMNARRTAPSPDQAKLEK